MLKRLMSSVLVLAIGLPLSAADNKKETERLENCGMVLKEILEYSQLAGSISPGRKKLHRLSSE